MRHLALAATLVAGAVVGSVDTATAADPTTDGLVISEYVEGSSFNKAIEIYNGTGAPVSLAGLQFRLYSNGRPLIEGPTSTYAFPDQDLADGDVFVVVNPSLNDDEGFTLGGDVDAESGAINFNGDDAFTVVDGGGNVVDSFGQVGFRAQYGQDVTLRRTVFTRDTNPTDAFDASRSYASFDSDDVSHLGVAPGQTPPPPPEPTSCDIPEDELDLISEVQGVSDDGSKVGTEVTVRGVVTLADDDLRGFFVQEEADDQDADPATSEGIFVFDFRSLPTEGQTVTLTDTVTERIGETQLSVPDIDVCDVPLVSIASTPLTLPLDNDEREAFEGMLVTNAQDLQVTGLFTAYRFGELGLALDGPLPVPTSVFAPGSPKGAALAAENAVKELFVNDRDEAFGQFNPYPWELFDEDLSAGDTMPANRLVGALKYSFGDFKVEPIDNDVQTGDRVFFPETDDTFPRPDAPILADGNDVASFNVLNYFNTFGDSAVLRGAENQEDFDVQSAKIVDAIIRLDAKIVGLIEIENDYEDFYDDDDSTVPSIVTLVKALNNVAGKNTWAYVRPNENILTTDGLGGGGLGPDAIAQGLIYQRKLVTVRGPATTFDIDALLEGDKENNRWPLAQTFRIDGEDVTVVVNHFKSKGSSCADTAGPGFALGDDAGSDETGNCNLVREYAADRLLEWVDNGATRQQGDDVLLIGDFNSYEEEGPIEKLVDAGYVDVIQSLGDDAFTFKFDGRYGRLDYAFASSSLADDVPDAAVWQINSPAPVGYIYFNDPIDLTAHGSSDHDPVVVSLR
ncbi:MAG: ExeM/NucH family extracellular endonuclease [Ilumatobacteraceae bacterium]